MKKLIALFSLLAGVAFAAPDVTITNWIPNYVFANSFTNAGDTGLSTNLSYMCIPVSDITYLTNAQASQTNAATSDIRAVLYGVMSDVHATYEVLASTNIPSYFTISEIVRTDSSTNSDIIVTHKMETYINLSTTTLPSE